jgi:hypothetical protein
MPSYPTGRHVVDICVRDGPGDVIDAKSIPTDLTSTSTGTCPCSALDGSHTRHSRRAGPSVEASWWSNFFDRSRGEIASRGPNST